jgi:hypothetical protein
MICPSCSITLRPDNPGPLCSVCFGLVSSFVVNNLPYWEACEQLDRDENERRTAEVRRLLRTDENFFEGGQR